MHRHWQNHWGSGQNWRLKPGKLFCSTQTIMFTFKSLGYHTSFVQIVPLLVPSRLAHHGQSSALIHRGLAKGHQFLWRCCFSPKSLGASKGGSIAACANHAGIQSICLAIVFRIFLKGWKGGTSWKIHVITTCKYNQGWREVLQRGVSIVAINRVIKTRL